MGTLNLGKQECEIKSLNSASFESWSRCGCDLFCCGVFFFFFFNQKTQIRWRRDIFYRNVLGQGELILEKMQYI